MPASFDDDPLYEIECPMCGENEPLSPLTGVCFDCENDDGEIFDEEEGEYDVCTECGMEHPTVDDDGVCGPCRDDEEED